MLIVLVGVPLVAGLLLAMLYPVIRPQDAPLPGNTELLRGLFNHDPSFEAEFTRLHLSADRYHALAEGTERLALIYSLAGRPVERVLKPGQLRSIEQTATGLTLRVADFTTRHIRIRLDAEAAIRWRTLLSPYLNTATGGTDAATA